jgi:hypothetical protein
LTIEELLHDRIWGGLDLSRCPGGNDHSIVEHRHMRGQGEDFWDLMADDNGGKLQEPMLTEDELVDRADPDGIEAGGRLVKPAGNLAW